MAERMRCEIISWSEVYRLSRHLAERVMASGYRPDVIVAIGRGGYVPARLLCDFLHSMALTSIKVEHYAQGAHRQPRAVVRYRLGIDVHDLRLLVVDDVNDSGDTFDVVRDYLATQRPREVRTAVMHNKQTTHFSVDYYAKRIRTWRWLIYPWALIEDLTGFLHRMSPPPSSAADAADCLRRDYGLNVSRRTLDDVFRFMALAPATAHDAKPPLSAVNARSQP